VAILVVIATWFVSACGATTHTHTTTGSVPDVEIAGVVPSTTGDAKTVDVRTGRVSGSIYQTVDVGTGGQFRVMVPLGVYILTASNGCTSNLLRIHTPQTQPVVPVFVCPRQ